jgi:hypothetical protein
MMSRLSMLTAALLVLACCSSAQAVILAHWQFENGPNFLNDASGNGHHLTDPGVAGFSAPAFSADKPALASVDGSAQFNGTSSFTQSVIPLALSSNDFVRFTYWMKVETAASDLMVFENSFDTNFQVNTGSTFHLANASGTPAGTALVAHRTTIGFPSSATTLDIGTYSTMNEWHHIRVDYNFADPVPDERIKIFVNGVEGSTLRSISGAHTWERLRDDILYIGGRKEFSGNPSLLFTGKLADVKIEAIPEPASLALWCMSILALGLISQGRFREVR